MHLKTFIITSNTGEVLDFGTYFDEVEAQDNANESPEFKPGNTVTLIEGGEEGSWRTLQEPYTVPAEPQVKRHPCGCAWGAHHFTTCPKAN